MQAVDLKLSFDDILSAVKESSRGRWFLDEFESRTRKNDTASILAAINKIENAIVGMSASGGEAAILAKARAAIVSAKKDIANLDPNAKFLTDEAQMFAKLAELAKASFHAGSPTPAVNEGVLRALKLVDEIEADLNPTAKPSNVVQLSVAQPESQKYFEKHADVFEKLPAPAPAQVASAVAPAPKAQEPEMPRGAKLVINRLPSVKPSAPEGSVAEGRQEPEQTPSTASTVPAPAADMMPAETPVSVSTPSPAAHEEMTKPRVIIIRRKPEESVNVPLFDQPIDQPAA